MITVVRNGETFNIEPYFINTAKYWYKNHSGNLSVNGDIKMGIFIGKHKQGKKSTKTTFKGRQTQEDFNEDLFLELYVDAAIRGWSGLKFKYVDLLAPVDVSKFDPEDDLGYSKENALMLIKNSTDFDSFVSERVNDLGNFATSN